MENETLKESLDHLRNRLPRAVVLFSLNDVYFNVKDELPAIIKNKLMHYIAPVPGFEHADEGTFRSIIAEMKELVLYPSIENAFNLLGLDNFLKNLPERKLITMVFELLLFSGKNKFTTMAQEITESSKFCAQRLNHRTTDALRYIHVVIDEHGQLGFRMKLSGEQRVMVNVTACFVEKYKKRLLNMFHQRAELSILGI